MTLPFIDRSVARHFTPDELRQAAEFLAEHACELPQAEKGARVFPDPLQKRIARELRRIAEGRRLNIARDEDNELTLALSEEDYDALVESAPESLYRSQEMHEVMARIEAAAVASRHRHRRDKSVDRFMATADEYLEPYFAVRKGIPLGQAAKKFNVADIQAHVAAIERWLSQLEVIFPQFDRDTFLARLERAIEKRRKDAIRVRPVGIPRELRVRHKAMPNGRRSQSGFTSSISPVTTNPRGYDLRTPETVRALARALALPPTRAELRNRQLDRGLIAIQDAVPFDSRRSELVDIVDMSKLGITQPEIARRLGLSTSSVARRLALVLKAGEIGSFCGLEVEDEAGAHATFPPDIVNNPESVSYATL